MREKQDNEIIMNETSKAILEYYSDCIKEEAKYSVLKNIRNNKDLTVVKIGKNNKVFSQYPAPLPCPEKTAELTEVMLKESNNPELQLIYVYKFVQYNDEKGQPVVTPFIYSPCTVSREQGSMCVKINTDKPILNGNLFLNSSRMAKNDKDVSTFVNSFLTLIPSVPFGDKDLNALEVVLKSVVPELKDCVYTNDSAVILCKMTKSYAGIFNDYLRILNKESLDNCSLSCISAGVPEQLKVENDLIRVNYNDLSKSQEKAVNTALKSKVSAIIGAPGTGKSTTIVGLATTYIANGKSVLIASKMNEALNVIEDRLNVIKGFNSLPQFYVRTGNKTYRKDLGDLLEKILSSGECKKSSIYTLKEVRDLYDRYNTNEAYDDEFLKLDYELENIHGKKFTIKEHFDRLKKRLRKNRLKNKYDSELSTRILQELESARRQAFVYAVVKKHNNTVNGVGNRQVLLNMSKTLKRYGNIGEDEFAYATKYMLPCWLSTVNDVSDSIPCIEGLFDVVIIDESSQCDIASALPLLYRAKQAVIVGDNNQIKFLSFMENVKTDYFMVQREIPLGLQPVIDYKRNSLFDFGVYYSAENPVMLTEYYRGHYDLVRFSNEKFYGGKLIGQCTSALYSNPIDIHYTKWATCDRKKTCNYKEASAIIDMIRVYTGEQFYNDLNIKKPLTIGILSPFKAQVELIRDMLKHSIDEEIIRKHNIIVGTAHAFQGNERDIMLLSFAVDKNSHVQSHTFINNPNLFNVAITRAKVILDVFVSYDPSELGLMPNGLLKEYLLSRRGK